MDSKSKFDTLTNAFQSMANAEKAAKMAAYMRNKFEFLGIPAPERKAITKAILKTDKKTGAIDWNFLNLCWADNYREFQYVAIDYLIALQNHLLPEDIHQIEKLIRTKPWWDTIDGLDGVIGSLVLRSPQLNDLMLRWSVDSDFWVRRTAIDHQLGRKETTDTELLAAIILNNLGSREFFINKAIGWSLREYSRTDPQWVREFLRDHSTKMSSLSVREASKYV